MKLLKFILAILLLFFALSTMLKHLTGTHTADLSSNWIAPMLSVFFISTTGSYLMYVGTPLTRKIQRSVPNWLRAIMLVPIFGFGLIGIFGAFSSVKTFVLAAPKEIGPILGMGLLVGFYLLLALMMIGIGIDEATQFSNHNNPTPQR